MTHVIRPPKNKHYLLITQFHDVKIKDRAKMANLIQKSEIIY